MWSHALSVLKCPACKGALLLHPVVVQPDRPALHERGPAAGTLELAWIEDGALECNDCRIAYPIQTGVPVMLNYTTKTAVDAASRWPDTIQEDFASRRVTLPEGSPPPGEQFVSASFSTEWAAYDYGANLWTAPVEDRVRTFRGECGISEGGLKDKQFCEIGCGLGITTNEAATTLGAEAWGVDLSVAVFRAAMQFRDNPNLHFVQASVFNLPFENGQFDFLYSHGVLHHTWSTREAITQATSVVQRGGGMYVWLYGHDDVQISVARRVAYALETVTRPIIARLPSWLATLALLPTIPAYQLASAMSRHSGTHMHTYSAKEALHAARDRFTPLFAHRHDIPEVSNWLRELGFEGIHRVTGAEVSEGWALAIDRNVALRARLRAANQETGIA